MMHGPTVEAQFDRKHVRVGNYIGGNDCRSPRCKRITGFPPLPLTVRELKIPRTDIVEGGVAEHVFEGAIRADNFSAPPHDNRSFPFVFNFLTVTAHDTGPT